MMTPHYDRPRLHTLGLTLWQLILLNLIKLTSNVKQIILYSYVLGIIYINICNGQNPPMGKIRQM